jgi:hypothetical protein
MLWSKKLIGTMDNLWHLMGCSENDETKSNPIARRKHAIERTHLIRSQHRYFYLQVLLKDVNVKEEKLMKNSLRPLERKKCVMFRIL